MEKIKRSLAIVIGIDQYTHIPKLKNAVSDASELANVLKNNYNYEVLLLLNQRATKEKFDELLANLENKTIQFNSQLIQVEPSDRILFYFAGHGFAEEAQDSEDGKPAGYFMPQDADDGKPNTWLSMQKLYEAFTSLDCHHLLMILDCCFAGRISWVGKGRNAARSRKLYQQSYDHFIKHQTQQIITSAAHDEKAQDSFRFGQRGDINGHSPFAYLLLKILQGNSDGGKDKFIEAILEDKVIIVHELFTYLQNQLGKIAEGQTPALSQPRKYDQQTGEYVFLKGEYVFPLHNFNPQNLPPLTLDKNTNPYKGLAPFEKEDSQLFFGRKRLIEEPKEGLLTKVNNHPLTVVLGTSGSGKSSLVKAGLIPALKEFGQQKWVILDPMRPSESPVNALNKILTKSGSASSTILSLSYQEKNQVIFNKIDDLISPDSKLLLVIDQTEELFTLCQNQEERTDFINLLAQLLKKYQEQLRIVLTLRSEFEPQIRDAIKETHWQKVWKDGRFIVTQMDREELQQAIEEPAAQRALFFESPKLVNDLIDEVVQMPGALPLLSFTLSELYLKYLKAEENLERNDRTITEADYQEIGGVTRSLTQTANKTYDKLVKEEKIDESTIRDVMLRMVAISGRGLARRQVPTSELVYPGRKNEQAKKVIDCFSEARLLVTGLDTENQAYVEPVHDTLVRGWTKLINWIDNNQDRIALQQNLTPVVVEWAKNNLESGYLWKEDPRLAVLEKMIDPETSNTEADNWLSLLERDFVQSSIQKRQDELREKQERLDDALRSQSIFLARESRQQTESGRPDLGIKLALEALPRQLHRPQRPWVRTAESALYSAFAQHEFTLILGGSRAGFGDSLVKAKISPDGTRAVLDYGVQAELWSLETGELLKTFRSDDDSSDITHVTFSPDGRFLTIAYKTLGTLIFMGEDGQSSERGSVIETVNAHTGELIRQFQVPGHRENYIHFSPSGNLLLVATDVLFLWIDTAHWEPIDGDTIETIGEAFSPPYLQALFSKDENNVVIVTDKGFVGVVDRVARTSKDLLQSEKRILGLLLLGRNGTQVALALGAEVHILDTDNPRNNFQLPMLNPERILSIAYSDRRSTIVAVTEDARVHSWPMGEEQIELDASGSTEINLRTAYLDESGTRAIVNWEDGTIEFWDIQQQQRNIVLPSGETHLIDVSFAREGSSVLLASNDNVVRIWDSSLVKPIQRRLEVKDSSVSTATLHPYMNQCAIGYRDGSIQIKELDTANVIWNSEVLHRDIIEHLAFDSSGSRLISTSKDLKAIIWDLRGERVPIELTGHTRPVEFGAFSLTSDLVVTGSSDSTFRLWDVSSGQELRVLAIPELYLDPIYNASINAQAKFTSDGRKIVTVTSGDGFVIGQPALVWDVQSGELLNALEHRMASIWDIAITPDNRYVVTTSYDKSVALWDINTGERVQTFLGHTVGVLKAVVFDEDRLLATASPDGSLHIWSFDSGLLVHDLRVDQGLTNLEISHNGRFLASGSSQEEGWKVIIWDGIEGSPLMRIIGLDGPLKGLKGLKFTHDDLSLLTQTETGTVTIWALPPTGQSLIDAAWQRVGQPEQKLLTREQRIRFAIEAP